MLRLRRSSSVRKGYRRVVFRPVSDRGGDAAAAMRAAVPWVRTVGVEFGEVLQESDATTAVAHLPDDPALHNHVGGAHAAMTFGLGETAAGVVVLAAFGPTLDRAVPLVARAEIGYLAVARGPLTARAVLSRPAAEVLTELDAGRRPEFPVVVTVTDAQGRETARLTVTWTLKPVGAGQETAQGRGGPGQGRPSPSRSSS